MKKVLVLFFILFSLNVYADQYYIINSDKDIMAVCNYEPDEADLNSRGEFAVRSDSGLLLEEAMYRNKKIVKKVLTAKEKKAKKEYEEMIEEEKLINKEMREQAIEK